MRHGSSVDVDLHWRSSNSPALARLMDYEEMQARAVPVPSLGPAAFAPCPVHALLFACIHRAGHEHAPMYVDGVAVPVKDRLIWLYDIHLLASKMQGAELEDAFFGVEQEEPGLILPIEFKHRIRPGETTLVYGG